MVRMVVLSNYVSDGSFFSFHDEEAITSFLLMYRNLYEVDFTDIKTLVQEYLQKGFYRVGKLSVHQKGHLIVYQKRNYTAQEVLGSILL